MILNISCSIQDINNTDLDTLTYWERDNLDHLACWVLGLVASGVNSVTYYFDLLVIGQ